MILSPHRILWYSHSPPLPSPTSLAANVLQFPLFPLLATTDPFPPLLLLHFTSRPMGFPQRIFHTFRKMNESWSLIWWAKLSGALDKMIESQTKSYTDKLQDITCARACSHLRLANTSRRFQCACSGDMKTLKLPSSHSPRHSLGHSIGQTDNTLGSAANSRNAQGSTSKRL